MANDTSKCAHPACECQVSQKGEWGKYCSEYCKKSGDHVELRCGCHHANCK